jgi:hypothetical protein
MSTEVVTRLSRLVLDTSFILRFPQLDKVDWGTSPTVLVIPQVVLDELKGIARARNDGETQRNAQAALTLLEAWMQPHDQAPSEGWQIGNHLHLTICGLDSPPRAPLRPGVPDHVVVATALDQMARHPAEFVATISGDHQLTETTAALGGQGIYVPQRANMNGHLGHQIRQRAELWRQSQRSRVANQRVQAACQHRSAEEVYRRNLQRTGHHLASVVRQHGNRALISIQTEAVQLALACHFVQRQTRHKRQCVLVVVDRAEKAQRWTAELTTACSLPAGAVQYFDWNATMLATRVRVAVYARQALQYAATHGRRFRAAGRSVTCLISGADECDAVDLALLLPHTNRFVGIVTSGSHLTATPAGRLLSALYPLAACYGFRDAGDQRLVPAYDAFCVAVQLSDTEKALVDSLIADQTRLQGTLARRYPGLGAGTDDYWLQVQRLVEHGPDVVAAALLSKRAQLDAVAIQAEDKRSSCQELIMRQPAPARAIVYETSPERVNALAEALKGAGRVTAFVAPHQDANGVADLWQEFRQGKVEVLVATGPLPPGLPRASVHAAIFVSPSMPAGTLLACVDRTLASAALTGLVRLYLLCVPGSREQDLVDQLSGALLCPVQVPTSGASPA